MRWVVLSLVLFTSVFSSASDAADKGDKLRKTSSIPPGAGGRFVDKGRGFSINLPVGWNRDEDTLGTAVMAISKADGPKDAFRENINVVVETLKGSMAAKEYFDASQGVIKKVFQDFKLEKSGKERVNNKDFYWSIFTHKTPTAKARVLQYVSVNGLRAYIITCSASPEAFESYRGTFQNSVRSFKFE